MLLKLLPTFRGEVFLKITVVAKKLSTDCPVWQLETIDTDGPIAEWAARVNRSISPSGGSFSRPRAASQHGLTGHRSSCLGPRRDASANDATYVTGRFQTAASSRQTAGLDPTNSEPSKCCNLSAIVATPELA